MIRMLGVFSTFDVALGLLPGVGLVCLHSQLPPPPPGLLTDWEFSKIDCMAVYVGIKLTFDVLGENPLYADIDCHTVYFANICSSAKYLPRSVVNSVRTHLV